MIEQQIRLPRHRWHVSVFYESTGEDAPEILRVLEEAGADFDTLRRAERNLTQGLPDTGLTYTNPRARVSIVIISRTSSRKEFANTWLHETLHTATHIATAEGLDLQSEAVAYIGGALAREMQPVAARLMCPTCPSHE